MAQKELSAPSKREMRSSEASTASVAESSPFRTAVAIADTDISMGADGSLPPMSDPSDPALPTGAPGSGLGGLDLPLIEVMRRSGEPVRLRRDPISDEILDACLDAASAGLHSQPRYELVVVRDADRKHQLARIYRQGWSVYRRLLARSGASLEARQWEADHFEDVPIVIVACAKGLRPVLPAIGEARYYAAVLPPMQNLMLAARAMGLSASMSTLAVWSGWQARRTLELPYRLSPVAVVTVGYAADTTGDAPNRRGRDFAVLDAHGHPFPEKPK